MYSMLLGNTLPAFTGGPPAWKHNNITQVDKVYVLDNEKILSTG